MKRTALCVNSKPECFTVINDLNLTIRDLICPKCKTVLFSNFKQSPKCVLFSSLATPELIENFINEEKTELKRWKRLKTFLAEPKWNRKSKAKIGPKYLIAEGDEILFKNSDHDPKGFYDNLAKYNKQDNQSFSCISEFITFFTVQEKLNPRQIIQVYPIASDSAIGNWTKKLGLTVNVLPKVEKKKAA